MLRSAAVPGMLAVLAACTDVPRRPLDAALAEQTFQARTLEDAHLRELAAARDPSREWPPSPLRLPDLVLAAWSFDPALDAARAAEKAARAGVTTAGTLPNPTLSLTPTWVTQTTDPPWVLTVAGEWLLELAGHRGKRVAVAEQRAVVAALAAGDAAWDAYRRVRDAFLERSLEHRELAVARDEAQLREALVQYQETRLEAGAISRDEVLRARAEALRTTLEVTRLEAAQDVRDAALARSIGIPVAELQRCGIAEDLLVADGAGAISLVDRLDLRRKLGEYELAERELELELSRQYPDLRLGPGYEYDQGSNKWMLGLGIELPVFDQNQGPIQEAVAHREQVAAEFLALQVDALGAQQQALAEVQAARTRADALAGSPAALQQAREEADRQALQAGAADGIAGLQTRLEGVLLARARLEAERDLQLALARLEDARQRPLDGTPWNPPASGDRDRE